MLIFTLDNTKGIKLEGRVLVFVVTGGDEVLLLLFVCSPYYSPPTSSLFEGNREQAFLT